MAPDRQLELIHLPLGMNSGERHCISAVAFMVAGGGFGPRNFGLRDLTHISMGVGLYGCGGQGRDGGIGVFQSKTRADGDNSTCLGGRRWDEYRRRNIRTYSSMSRDVLSALRITHVLKHNDASESGFYDHAVTIYKEAESPGGGLEWGFGPDWRSCFSRIGTQLAHRSAKKPRKVAVVD